MIVPIETTIMTGIANIIAGRSSVAEYEAIVETVKKLGGDRLVELYNTWCVSVDPPMVLSMR